MTSSTATQAQDLRHAFDLSFTQAPSSPTAAKDFIAMRLGGVNYAMDLSKIAGLYTDKRITRTPARGPGFLGIAGFRGNILPVYDLAVLAGLPPGTDRRWLAVATGQTVAVTFDAFAGHLRVPHDDIFPHTPHDTTQRFVRQAVRAPGGVMAVIDLAAALQGVAGSPFTSGVE